MNSCLTLRTSTEQERNLHSSVSEKDPELQPTRTGKTCKDSPSPDSHCTERRQVIIKPCCLKYKYHHVLRRIKLTSLLKQSFWAFPILFILEFRVMLSCQQCVIMMKSTLMVFRAVECKIIQTCT